VNRDELIEILREALEIVEEAFSGRPGRLPPALEAAAFDRVLGELLAGRVEES